MSSSDSDESDYEMNPEDFGHQNRPNYAPGAPIPISKKRKCVKDGAKFAVQVYNRFQQDEYVEIKRIVKAEASSGCNLTITIESKEARFYEAAVHICRNLDPGFKFYCFEPTKNPEAKVKALYLDWPTIISR